MPKNRRVKRTGRNRKEPAKAKATTRTKAPAGEPTTAEAQSDTRAEKPPRSARRKARRDAGPGGGRSGEIVGIVLLGATIFMIAALFSLQVGSGLLMGPLGRTTASTFYGFTGLCSYLLAAVLVAMAVRLLMERTPVVRLQEVAGISLGVAALATLMHLLGDDYRVAGHGPGGVVGEHIAEVLRAIVSTAGTALLAVTGLFIAVVIGTPLRMRQVGTYLSRGTRFLWVGVKHAAATAGSFCGEVIRAVLPEREHDEYLEYDEYDEYDEYVYDPTNHEAVAMDANDPPIIEASGGVPTPMLDVADTERVASDAALAEKVERALDAAEASAEDATPEPVTDEDTESMATPDAAGADASAKKRSRPRAKKPALIVEDEAGPESQEQDAASQKQTKAESEASEASEASDKRSESAKGGASEASEAMPGPMIVESEFMTADKASAAWSDKESGERLDFIPLGDGQYQLPSLSLLDQGKNERSALDREAMLELSARLTKTLENYGVRGEVVAIRPGPVVTMYEFAPAPGIRLSKITNLNDDLAMALEALSVRIVAPIPGKAVVGIEVPNRKRETVYFSELIRDEVFTKGRHKLPLAVGKNIEGAPQVVDLAKMPHLLVAGTTGSGKSVSVNSMILSLLYKRTPAEVRMIMVDPKMLELSIYEGVPHLLLPVVTDPKKANLALRWGVEEMERRYELLAKMGVRDLASYNKKVAKLKAKFEAEKLRMAADEAERLAEADDFVEITQEHEAPQPAASGPEELPYIVIVIDEFADLMMCAPKEVETSVARIAQKARAAGIHLILATQRPSVDVITGLIKANFPSRAAFRVTSKVDSRTVLDQGGAETLLGAGDMLFTDRGATPVRYHGCFINEDEIARVVEFLETQGKPVYNMDIIKPRDEDVEGEASAGAENTGDSMYDRAVALVAETQQVSISMIQRRLRVGYNRAARMVEEMERQGVVSPPDHTNKREVLISDLAA